MRREPTRSAYLAAGLTESFKSASLGASEGERGLRQALHKKSSWIGAQNFPGEVHEEVKNLSRRELPIFRNRQEALNWLVGDSMTGPSSGRRHPLPLRVVGCRQ
jgi:hypothetical protein